VIERSGRAVREEVHPYTADELSVLQGPEQHSGVVGWVSEAPSSAVRGRNVVKALFLDEDGVAESIGLVQ